MPLCILHRHFGSSRRNSSSVSGFFVVFGSSSLSLHGEIDEDDESNEDQELNENEIDECDESNDNEEKWIPFVFDNSLEDGPRDERDFLLCMMGEALHKWRTRPKWIRGTCPGYVEETSLVGWMLDSGICLSLRDPPRHDVWDPYEDPPINEDHRMNGDVD